MVNKYDNPTLAWILDYWPATVLVPTILVLITVLALITRWWDERDAARETARRGNYSVEATQSVAVSEPASS